MLGFDGGAKRLTVGAVVLVLLTFAAQSASAATVGPKGVFWTRQATPPAALSALSAQAETPAAPAPFQYYGGRVLRTNETFVVFWDPEGTLEQSYKDLVVQFLQDVAHDSGQRTNVYSVLEEYGDQTGPIRYQSSFAGSATDTDPFPAPGAGCDQGQPFLACVDRSQIQEELDGFLAAQGIARPGNRVFFVVTPKDVRVCSPSLGCSGLQYCAFHWGFDSPHGATNYAVNPFVSGVAGCEPPGRHPNANDADAMLSGLSHEHREMIDDPDVWAAASYAPPLAWASTVLGETSDACEIDYGPLQSNGVGDYNTVIDGHQYLIQEDWSNIAWRATGDGCVGQGNDVAPTAAFTATPGGGRVSFDASASNDSDPGDSIASYDWDFGDGTTGTGRTPTHAYLAPGPRVVRLTVTDQAGAFLWVEHSVTAPDVCTSPGAIRGTSHGDTLNGTPGDDVICGLGGDDTIKGRGGTDLLLGGAGSDTITGGSGADSVSGGEGDDSLRTDGGDDTLDGGGGADRLTAGDGADQLTGGAGEDRLDGGDGADHMDGGTGGDDFNNGAGDDTVEAADAASDTVNCGPGLDSVSFDVVDRLRQCGPGQATLTCAEVTGGTLPGPLTVPEGATCRISNAAINGDVEIKPGGEAVLILATVHGSVHSNGGVMTICSGAIDGDVIGRRPPTGRWDTVAGYCGPLHIGGSATLAEGSTGPDIEFADIAGSLTITRSGTASTDPVDANYIQSNTIGQDLTLKDNGPAATFVGANTVAGNLTCKNNDPDPDNGASPYTAGGPNSVAGRRQGETCADPAF